MAHRYGILTTGDNPELAVGEFTALQEVEAGAHPARSVPQRILLTDHRAVAERFVQRLAWGRMWGSADADEAGLDILARAVRANAPGQGSAAVRSIRFGAATGLRRTHIERTLGAALVDAGHSIDLQDPDFEVLAWVGDDGLFVGELLGERADQFGDRAMDQRAHFSPIGLHPRRAASLVHLARVPRGGRILDPFCGTGGILIEAALLGYEAWGSDLDPWMVQGSNQALADAAPEPLPGNVFHADIGDVPDLVEGIDGIVTDMPYGGASTTHDEALPRLYRRALEAFARILPPGGCAVIGHRDPSLLEPAPEYGLEVMRDAHHLQSPFTYKEYVHGSMTRHYTVLRRV